MDTFLHAASIVLILCSSSVASDPLTEIFEGPRTGNERILICRVTGVDGGAPSNVENAVFYLNGTDVRRNLTEQQYTEERGRLTFEISQALEGRYTCGNESADILSNDHRDVWGKYLL